MNVGWTPVDDGASIGRRGSEDGVILRDEQHIDGARITLERDGKIAPFSITSGIYGWMVHTSFFGTRSAAETAFEDMKDELAGILDSIPLANDPEADNKLAPVSEAISKFVDKHP